MVYRIYVERKTEFATEAKGIHNKIKTVMGINRISDVRALIRYDVEGITEEELADCANVFADPRTDYTYDSLPNDADAVFAVEYLPGQYDQRADAAAQCIRLIRIGSNPIVRVAKVYLLNGKIDNGILRRIKSSLINPVDSREAQLEPYDTIITDYPEAEDTRTLDGFTELDLEGLNNLVKQMGLAMDIDDALFCQSYFVEQGRNPTETEIRVIDTYWSDHCRHTTFHTNIENVVIDDEDVLNAYNRYLEIRKELNVTKPICLMDIATIGAKRLKAIGKLNALDDSKEINACTIKIDVEHGGKKEPWLLLFKNETHNHPTEIEPFGGAATCIGGAIRDPLSGRGYVYQGMRVTGAADPRIPIEKTLANKLPQSQIVTQAAKGFSSYGNQIGLATGIVDEVYHNGYAAKRMEVGAVIAAVPRENVVRLEPEEGDVVLLIGGRTGRDGCGGATGSSKAHTSDSIHVCGAEVQKGNAPEERKLQRLFRNGQASRLIKRCNDFGAGGVSVAIGELADGLEIALDKAPKKYMGLNSTELAISESQERMAVVVAKDDVDSFIELSNAEGLTATPVARITREPRLVMYNGAKKVVDISRQFIDSNGAKKYTDVKVARQKKYKVVFSSRKFEDRIIETASNLNCCSKRGLVEMFDSTVGAGTVLMPFGGIRQATPIQAMAAKLPVIDGDTSTCSLMAYGFDPNLSEASPYRGAYTAVVESVSKLVATGADPSNCYLSLQEYFEKPMGDPARWGKPFAALLGALMAQEDIEVGAIGGKDSMSGTFNRIDVPPTLISFAVGVCDAENVISPEFKKADSNVWLLAAPAYKNGLPIAKGLRALMRYISQNIRTGNIISAYTPSRGGVAEGLLKQAMGNAIGIKIDDTFPESRLFEPFCGGFIIECAQDFTPQNAEFSCTKLGITCSEKQVSYKNSVVTIANIEAAYEGALESIYPTDVANVKQDIPQTYSYGLRSKRVGIIRNAAPEAIIPVFPGTNCEYETATAIKKAGMKPLMVVIRNQTEDDLKRSICDFARHMVGAQLLFIPGGFSNGDEPDGSGKFIASFLQNDSSRRAVEGLLANNGLIGGICNGFQALIRTGLLPYGAYTAPREDMPMLAENLIGRHQSRIVNIRVASVHSPWLRFVNVGEVYSVPISHGEGRFVATDAMLKLLADGGQIITQYANSQGEPTMDISYNPNGSKQAIEGICSPDGRIFGKMGHSERIGRFLYKNVNGRYDMRLFEAAAEYFR